MRRLKILHIDPDDLGSPTAGGGPVRTFEIYRRLAKRHDVTVLTPSFPGSRKEETKEGIRYIRLGRRYGNHNSTYFISFYFASPIAPYRFPADIIVEDLMPPTAATTLPLFHRKKIVASVQWFFANDWAKRYKIPFHWYQPFGLKLYKHFVVLTESMKDKILKFNPRANICVIPNGLNDNEFQNKVQSEDFILYLGRVENHQKGVHLLIEAFYKISDQTSVKLVIAGDGVDLDSAKRQAAALGLSHRVAFEGKVGFERKSVLLSRCRFVCIPSRYEAFCMVALEAFACAKPVVAFDIPFLDIVRDSFSIRVKPFDVDFYAAAILNLLNHPEKTMEMGNRALAFARNYTWDEIAKTQEEFYFKALAD